MLVNTANQIIFTAQPQASQIALNEVSKLYPMVKFLDWLDAGVGRLQLNDDLEHILKVIKEKPPIFIRHICSINLEIDVEGELNILNAFEDVIRNFIHLLHENKSFSVQTRILGDNLLGYKKFDITKRVSDIIEQNGFCLNVKHPDQIISIVCKNYKIYIGIALSQDNLSNWAGGIHRFAYEDNQISRAEFKLLEAIDVFNLDLKNYYNALDLGAAPGGWTKILRKYNLKVVAVDPAMLHQDLASDTRVSHFKGLAQDFLNKKNKFDVIVNDMRMNAVESSKLMGKMSSYLNPDGLVIMTLKLPEKGMQRITNQCIKVLEQWYEIYAVRQLFHNRSEVTVILKSKSNYI